MHLLFISRLVAETLQNLNYGRKPVLAFHHCALDENIAEYELQRIIEDMIQSITKIVLKVNNVPLCSLDKEQCDYTI